MRKYQQVSANLLSEFILGPLAESVGFDPEEAGRSLPVAVLSPDGLFVTRLFQVVETGVQVQAFGRDGGDSGDVGPVRAAGYCEKRGKRSDFPKK